jgi:hypothetical protein
MLIEAAADHVPQGGMTPEELPPMDLSQMEEIADSRRKETALRYRRLASEWLRPWAARQGDAEDQEGS